MSKYVSAYIIAQHGTKTNSLQQVVPDPKTVDVAALAQQIEDAYNTWDAQGVQVINVIPIGMGAYDSVLTQGGGVAHAPSYSITRGVILIGKT